MLLIIDNYDSFTFNLYQAFETLGMPTKVVKNDEITLEEIAELNPCGIVLSPGPGRPEAAGICVKLIQKFSTIFPILGVCLGHQAIAYAYGGKITSASHIFHGKKSEIFHNKKRLFQNMTNPFEAGRYHSLIVDKNTLPDVFEIEAETTEGSIMAIKHKAYPVFGVQFHPESILTNEGLCLLNEFLKLCQISKMASDLLNPSVDNAIKKSILISLKEKGESTEDIICFVEAFKKKMDSIQVDKPILDIVGTGGDGLKTVNFSTGAALIAASCGAYVVKHGNRAVSSNCGSADLIEAINLPIHLPKEKLVAQIKNKRFGFCFAPLFHPSLNSLRLIRNEIKIPTILNLLGPLLNPANAEHYVLGVYDKKLLEKFAEVLLKLGVKKSTVVHCEGMDEISTVGITEVAEISCGKIDYYRLDPREFGFTYSKLNQLQGNSISKNAALLLNAFQGEKGPISDSLALNAGMGLYIYGICKNIKEGVQLAKKNLENGHVMNFLKELKDE